MNQASPQGPEELRGWMPVEELRARIFALKQKAREDRATASVEEKFTVLDQMREMADMARAGRVSKY